MTQPIDRETLEGLESAVRVSIEALERASERLDHCSVLEEAAFSASEVYPSAHPKAGRFIAFDEPERLRELYRVVRQAQKGKGETT